LRYGSSFCMLTRRPRSFSRRPRLEAVSPLPRLEATPPVTKTCLVLDGRAACAGVAKSAPVVSADGAARRSTGSQNIRQIPPRPAPTLRRPRRVPIPEPTCVLAGLLTARHAGLRAAQPSVRLTSAGLPDRGLTGLPVPGTTSHGLTAPHCLPPHRPQPRRPTPTRHHQLRPHQHDHLPPHRPPPRRPTPTRHHQPRPHQPDRPQARRLRLCRPPARPGQPVAAPVRCDRRPRRTWPVRWR